MNSTIDRTFYIYKKAVKLGSFLQYIVHMFLGHDGYIWKNNLKVLWNHIVKNLQVKHRQCDSIIFSEAIFFEISKHLLDLCPADSRILYFW